MNKGHWMLLDEGAALEPADQWLAEFDSDGMPIWLPNPDGNDQLTVAVGELWRRWVPEVEHLTPLLCDMVDNAMIHAPSRATIAAMVLAALAAENKGSSCTPPTPTRSLARLAVEHAAALYELLAETAPGEEAIGGESGKELRS
jgi:hypothetical protein